MKVIGLTGGIAMGKSHAAAVFRRHHIPLFDSDQAVHRLQARGGAAVAPIEAMFPGAVRNGAVDRPLLRSVVLADPASLLRLEAILHPLVHHLMARFLARQRRARARLVVLDIPLLLETRSSPRVDCIAVVTAPASMQRQRLLRRGTLTQAQIAAVLARQLPDRERRRKADVLIHTGLSRYYTQARLRRLIEASR